MNIIIFSFCEKIGKNAGLKDIKIRQIGKKALKTGVKLSDLGVNEEIGGKWHSFG